MKTLSILFAAAFAASALAAGTYRAPAKIPSDMQMKHIYVQVGANGVGQITDGPKAQSSYPDIPIYTSAENGSGYYGCMGSAEEEFDNVPNVGPACIDYFEFYYCTGSAAVITIDFAFYQGTSLSMCPLNDGGCQGAGAIYTPPGKINMPNMPIGCYYVTVTLDAPLCVTGPFIIGETFTTTDGACTGPILPNGANTGMGLGKYLTWPWTDNYNGNIGVWASPADSTNDFTNVNGCWWWGCDGVINSSFMATYYGARPWMFLLVGDYAGNGPAYVAPRDKVWMKVSDLTTGAEAINLVSVYVNADGDTFGGLPFGDSSYADTFDICFMAQDAYLSSLAPAQAVNPFLCYDCTPVFWAYELWSGDINGDDAVNLLDLGIVLSNFNMAGQCP